MAAARSKSKSTNALKKVQLKPGHYSLRRQSDGAGDSGGMFVCIDTKKSLQKKKLVFLKEDGIIKVGCSVMCGSVYARTYVQQDWWCTTEVTEILSVNEDKTEVKFKTRNSVYIARSR